MITGQSQDPTTQAQILVGDIDTGGLSSILSSAFKIGAEGIVDTVAFSYSSDVLQLGDPFSVTIPNPRGEYTDKFLRGQKIRLFLSNPAVRGGAPTIKHLGRIIRRRHACSKQGTTIQLDCADLGWHLQNCDAPTWYVLQNGGTLHQLLTDPKFIDPSWGIVGLATDNTTNGLLKRGKNLGRGAAVIDMQALGALTWIQVEPGDKIADVIIQYARRLNRLVNVSCDGYLQVWLPSPSMGPSLYEIEFHGFDDPNRNKGNVLDAWTEDDATSVYTHVTCLGEIVGGDLSLDPANQNAAKRRGDFINQNAAPYVHRKTISDGEIFDSASARKQAEWYYKRGIFDSWQAVYVVRGHHQNGEWWEADTLCSVRDSVLGLDGDFYVASVRCDRDEGGDRTTVTLKKPGLLSAAFGVLPRAPRIRGSIVDNSGQTATTGIATEVRAP